MVDDRRLQAPPRARRRLDLDRPLNPMNAMIAADMINAAARGFLVRRRRNLAVRREDPPPQRLLSPMDIQRKFRRARRVKPGPKVFSKARIGSNMGTVKSKRKVSLRKLDPLKIKAHIDSNSIVSQSVVAYFGYPDAGSLYEQQMEGCKALANMFFRRSGVKLTTIDQAASTCAAYPSADDGPVDIRLRKLILTFLNTGSDGTNDFKIQEILVDKDDSITVLATAIRSACLAMSSVHTVSDAEPHGPKVYWPCKATLWSKEFYNATAGHDHWTQFAEYDLTNVMVDFAYKRKYKWQNTTPAGVDGTSGSTNINDIYANPLSGRVYKFKGPRPLIRDKVKFALPTINGTNSDNAFQTIEAQDHGHIQTNALRNSCDFVHTPLSVFQQPFKANQYFKNTLTEDKVYMPPGGYKQMIRSGKVTMNFKRFIQATTNDHHKLQRGVNADPTSSKPAKIGTSTMWALEPALRTDITEEVRLHVNYETWYTTKTRVADKKQPVVTAMTVQVGETFGSS